MLSWLWEKELVAQERGPLEYTISQLGLRCIVSLSSKTGKVNLLLDKRERQ